jgi:hypothetical protein
MSNYTEHYNLKKPLKTENYDVDVANTNNDIIDEKIYNKVDKISGRGLSTNDFTNEYKKKIDRIIEGTKGDSAYQIAVKNGFEGTEKKWLESLKGDKGDKGELVDLVKEEEGKNISIESANLPAIEVSIEGESQQATRSGKNLLDNTATTKISNGITFTVNSDKTVLADGTNDTSANSSLVINRYDLSPGTYILNGCPSGGASNTYRLAIQETGSYSILGSIDIGNGSGEFTIDTTTNVQIAIFIQKGLMVNNLLFKPMLRKATIADDTYEQYGASPSPDYPSPIENVEGNIEFKDVWKNLVKQMNWKQLPSISTGATVTIVNGYGTDFIEVDNTKNYIFSYSGTAGAKYVVYYDENKNFLGYDTNLQIDNYKNWNVTKYVRLRIDCSENAVTNLQLEIGTVATPYDPYKEQTVYFPLGEGQKLMEGSYLADDGIHHTRKKVVLDGTKTGWYTLANQTGTNTSYFCIPISNMKKASTLICDKFINRAVWNTDEEAIQSIIDNFIRLRINTSRASTVAELKTWLSNNPIIVEYELAEEEIVPYTETQKEAWKKIKNMILYKGTNNISCTGKLKIKYYTNEEMNEIYAKKEDLHEHANKSILDQTQEAFTTELKNKLDGLNNYVLPAPTSATLGGVKAGSNITIDADGTINAQLGSSGETSANDYEVLSNKPQIAGITLQGNKSLADLGIQGVETGKGLSSNDYTTTEKAKLAGVEAQANKYIHPNTSGNKHVPSGGSSGQVLKWKSDGTAQWDNLSSSGELGTDDLNSKKINGIYAQSTATNFLKSRNYPFDHADGFPFFDILLEVKNAGMYIMQELHLSYKISVQGQEVISYFTYMRFSTNNGSTWSAWRGHEGTTTQ